MVARRQYRQASHRRGLWRPEVLSLSKRTPPAVSSGMQAMTLSSNGRDGRLLDRKRSARLRAFRFLSERFAQRDRSGYAAEFFLFVLIVLTAVPAMFLFAHPML